MASNSLGWDDEISGPDGAAYPEGDSATVSIGPLLLSLLAIARRNLWLIVSIMAGFILAAIAMTLLVTPKYTASSSIEIADQSQQVLGDQFEQSSDEVASWDIDRFLTTQVSILRSRSLADRVVRKLNLMNDPRFFQAVQIDRDDLTDETSLREEVLDTVLEHLEVDLPPDSRIVEIAFVSTDPQLSAKIANTYAEEFIQANLQRKFDSSSYAREFVREQLEEARANLEQSEQQLNAYARNASLIRTRDPNSSENSTANSVTTSSLLQLNQAANQAKAERAAAEAQWNAERAQPLLSSPAALASPVVQGLQNRKSEIQANLENARERYKDDHPAIARLESSLSNIDAQLRTAATQARDAVRAQYVAAQAAERNLDSQVNALEEDTLKEQDRSVRYNTLAREADTNRSIYEGLLQRYRELNASAGITASNVSIIDLAEPPTNPSAPRPLFNLAIAIILGMIFAAAVVFLKDQLDDRIRVPEEVEEKVGVKLLGVIPDSKDILPVEALQDPKSMISESYSALRSSLLYSTTEGLPQLMLVTSAQASEGKSTTSYSIARGLGLIGKKALLIDADLRRPSIHRLADIANSAGLSDVLVGEKEAADVIVAGDTPNFDIMPSGPVPPSPTELLTSTRLTNLFGKLRNQYDCIVVDSAPVLGLADSPAMSAVADGVVLVIEADRGRGGQLKAAVRRLRMMKPTILGAVLTKFDPEAAGNTYSTYYHYDYYQYRSSEQ